MAVWRGATLLILISFSSAYKFLIVFPYAVKSLSMLGDAYVKLLTDAGHEVTYISPFPLKTEPKNNFRHIDVSQNVDVLFRCRSEKVKSRNTTSWWFGSKELVAHSNLSVDFMMESQYNMNDIQYFQEAALKTAVSTFGDEEVRELLEEDNQKFDAVIVDWFQTEIYTGLSALYSCPLIWSYSMGVDWGVLKLVDGPTNPAYTVDYLTANVPPLEFMQRVQELWMQIKSYFIKRFTIAPREKSLYENIFGPLCAKRNIAPPNYDDLVYNASLLLINDHHAIGRIPPLAQNVKFVGGYHIDAQVKPLPKYLQSIMDNAKYGIIYFAMGSSWQSKDIPMTVTAKLLEMFGKLYQTVIWKYEEELSNLPKNVHIIKWAPQHSILAHPNCILFITHGGILSSTEAIHFGVPTIGIPIYFDQFKNINKAVANGHTVKVDLNMELADNLRTAIEAMQQNITYRRRVKELSLIYHDRVVPPGVELVHWVEHVARTRGAAHLRSPALHVPAYQKMYLDLIAAILFLLIILRIVIQKTLISIRIRYMIVLKNRKKLL